MRTLAPFLTSCLIRKFQKGRIIIYQGEIPRHSYYVRSGTIKAYSITTLGEEKIAQFHHTDELFPLILTEHNHTAALYYYEALTDCELYLIPHDGLMSFLNENPDATRALLDYSTRSYASSLMRITALQQAKAQDKLAYILYHLRLRYGSQVKPGVYEIGIHLTHQAIANYVGMTRETIAIELSKLKRKGIVDYKNQRYFVNEEKLLAFINEDSLKNFALA